MTLRVGFDLDGVVADMESELIRQADILFGRRHRRRSPEPESEHASPHAHAPQEAHASERAHAAPRHRPETHRAVPSAAEPARDKPSNGIPHGLKLELSPRQQRRLWRHIETIDGFWESLQETEPGAVAALARLTADRRWEVIFLTKRPTTAGFTAQVQSQRWLIAHGFALPSVYVVQGSRGRIASALGLDVVVDDWPENCLDVLADSTARVVLVWRADQKLLPPATERPGITVVQTVAQCLEALVEFDSTRPEIGVVSRVKRLLGRKQPAGA